MTEYATPSTCKAKVRLHIIEEASLPGTAYSAIPKPGRFAPAQMHTATFHDAKSLERCVFDAVSRMHQQPSGQTSSVLADPEPDLDAPRHLLVISSHGRERTGTELAAMKESINAHLLDERLFQIRPESLVVYLSACWGAYPAFVQAARSGERRIPTIIGAIVPVHPRDANNLQKQIARVLCAKGHSEASLLCLVQDSNRRSGDRYPSAPFRIVLRNGRSYPSEGSPGLAAPTLRVREYMVVALQNWSAATPSTAVLLGADGRYRFASASLFPPNVATSNCFSLTGKSLWFDEPARIGSLCDISDVAVSLSPPRFFKAYKSPFVHAQHVPAAGTHAGRNMRRDALDTCKRCNWARIACKRTKMDELTSYSYSLWCVYAGRCPMH